MISNSARAKQTSLVNFEVISTLDSNNVFQGIAYKETIGQKDSNITIITAVSPTRGLSDFEVFDGSINSEKFKLSIAEQNSLLEFEVDGDIEFPTTEGPNING